jgi:hypothetical protein
MFVRIFYNTSNEEQGNGTRPLSAFISDSNFTRKFNANVQLMLHNATASSHNAHDGRHYEYSKPGETSL